MTSSWSLNLLWDPHPQFSLLRFQVDPNEAVTCLMKAIDIYTDMGRFNMAAKHHQSIAEMFENEANDLV
jgi:hypothetical protein